MCCRQGDIDCAHQSLTTMYISTRKQNMESPWSNTSVFSGGGTSTLSGNHNPPGRETKFLRLLTDFKKKMQQTELHARHLVHVKIPVNSLLLKHNAAQLIWVSKLHQHDQTRGRPYHKTIHVVFAARLLQIGDNQGPNADDVGNDVDQMWHTQIVCQDGFFQSGTRGHPITRLSALQPIHNEFGHCEPVQAAEHTGSCSL